MADLIADIEKQPCLFQFFEKSYLFLPFLGDGDYLCLQLPITVITPFKQASQRSMQECINKMHGRVCYIIERTFGVIKVMVAGHIIQGAKVALAFVFLHSVWRCHGRATAVA